MSSPGGVVPLGRLGRDAVIARERDRIAAELQNEVIQRVFAVGLNLQNVAAITVDPLVRREVEQAVTDLDRVVGTIRDAVFHLETGLKGQGLRARVVQLCEHLSPVPDVTFHGPVDGALHLAATAVLLDLLDDALTVLRPHWAPVAIDITAANGRHVTMVRAAPLPEARRAGEPDQEFPGLRERAAQAGIRIDIEPAPQFVQISWHAA